MSEESMSNNYLIKLAKYISSIVSDVKAASNQGLSVSVQINNLQEFEEECSAENFEDGYNQLNEYFSYWCNRLEQGDINPETYAIGCTALTAAFAAINKYQEK